MEEINWELIGIICTAIGAFYYVIKLTISKEINPITAVMKDVKLVLNELKTLVKANADKAEKHTKEIAIVENKSQAAHYRIDKLENDVDKIREYLRGIETDIATLKNTCDIKNGGCK